MKVPVSMETARILIVGGSGAGKSTLATQLESCAGIPSFDGDPIAFIDDHWTLRPLADRLRMVHEIAQRERWVVSTGQLVAVEELAERAAIIVWLDLPLPVLLWRITRRYLRDHPAGQGFDARMLVGNMWSWNIRWYLRPDQRSLNLNRDLCRAAMARVFAPYAGKLFRVHRNPLPGEVIGMLIRHSDR